MVCEIMIEKNHSQGSENAHKKQMNYTTAIG